MNPLRPNKVRDPEVRKKLGELISSMLDDAQNMRGSGLQERWEDCERRYRGEPDEQGIKVNEDAQPLAINIIKPRIDALVTKTCNPITSQRPYFSAFGFSSDKARIKENEDVVQFLWERADFPRKLRTATRLSCMAAPAIFKCPFSIQTQDRMANHTEQSQDVDAPYKYVGPDPGVIHPNDFAIYPLSTGGVMAARLVGDRIKKRVREVKELQKMGAYFDKVTVYGGDDPQSWESGRAKDWSLTEEASGISDSDDEMVELWDVIVKHDLDGDGYEERYRAVVARNQRLLLEFEQYGAMLEISDQLTGETSVEFVPYSRPWYFPHAVTMPAYNEFFHANPIVQDLIPIQGAYSDGQTLMIEGGKMQAFPAAFISGGSIDKVKRYRPGEYIPVEADVSITFAECKFKGEVWPMMFQSLKGDADALVRISQGGTAQTTGETASEAVIVNNNMEEGADEYRDVAALAPEEMCDFIRELAYIHYGTLSMVYQEQFPCQDRESLRKPLRWEATGKTSDSNPQVLTQNINEIVALLGNPIALQALMTTGINISALLKAYLKSKRWPVADSDLFPDAQPFTQDAPGSVPGIGPVGAPGDVPPGSVPPDDESMQVAGLVDLLDPGAGGMPPA